MKLPTLFIAVAFLLTSFKVCSQDTVIVFKDYASFLNNTGEFYNEMMGYSNGVVKVTLYLKKNGLETKVPCKDIWGFMYNRRLFRTDVRTGQMAMLINKGRVCYYENGIAHLVMIRDKTTKETFSMGYYCYISKNLETPLVPFPSPEVQVSDAHKQIRKFRKENPEYDNLFERFDRNYRIQHVRDVIEEYEEANQKR
jgi:hypothetical protein